MKLTIDTDTMVATIESPEGSTTLPLYSREAFESISKMWLKVGWNQKYTYTFTWLGRPVIQLPEDLIRIQELVYKIRPDVIIETGVAHGGSLIFYASLCELMGKGRVIGIDVEIRPHNKKAIQEHDLAPWITLVEGSSIDPAVISTVKDQILPGATVLVVLDSCHTREHVLAELNAYGPLVTRGSYLIVADGIMKDLTDVPRGKPQWSEDNPFRAVQDFLASHPEFRSSPPAWAFNESDLSENLTYFPGGYLLKVS